MEATTTQSTEPALEPGISEYELILMLNPTGEEAARNEFAGTTRARIEAGGTLLADHNWGVRKMAYEIDKHGESDYRYYRFRSEPPLLGELEHNLKIADNVLRFRIFKVDPRTPTTAPPELSTLEREREDRPERGERGERGDRSDRGGYSDRSQGYSQSTADDSAAEAEEVPAAPAAVVEPEAAEPAVEAEPQATGDEPAAS